MILTCPSCGTQYVVKDGAIPPGGRQVRCASCKHSWHQDSDGAEPAEAAHAPPPTMGAPNTDSDAAAQVEDESLAEATLIEPRSGPEAEEQAYEEAEMESAGPEPVAAAAVDPGPAEDWREPP